MRVLHVVDTYFAAAAVETHDIRRRAMLPMTPASVRAALHERGVLIREVERTGLRRLVFACGAFLGAARLRRVLPAARG